MGVGAWVGWIVGKGRWLVGSEKRDMERYDTVFGYMKRRILSVVTYYDSLGWEKQASAASHLCI